MAEGNALHRAGPFRMGAPPLGRLARWMNCLARQRLCVFASNQRRIEFSKGGGCPHLPWRLSGPALECMRECAHLMKAKQPGNFGYMQLAVIEVTNRQIAPQLLKYFSEVQPFVRKLSCQRPFTHSQTASNVFHEHSSMRKQRRDRVLNSRAQFAHISFSFGQSR